MPNSGGVSLLEKILFVTSLAGVVEGEIIRRHCYDATPNAVDSSGDYLTVAGMAVFLTTTLYTLYRSLRN